MRFTSRQHLNATLETTNAFRVFFWEQFGLFVLKYIHFNALSYYHPKLPYDNQQPITSCKIVDLLLLRSSSIKNQIKMKGIEFRTFWRLGFLKIINRFWASILFIFQFEDRIHCIFSQNRNFRISSIVSCICNDIKFIAPELHCLIPNKHQPAVSISNVRKIK